MLFYWDTCKFTHGVNRPQEGTWIITSFWHIVGLTEEVNSDLTHTETNMYSTLEGIIYQKNPFEKCLIFVWMCDYWDNRPEKQTGSEKTNNHKHKIKKQHTNLPHSSAKLPTSTTSHIIFHYVKNRVTIVLFSLSALQKNNK